MKVELENQALELNSHIAEGSKVGYIGLCQLINSYIMTFTDKCSLLADGGLCNQNGLCNNIDPSATGEVSSKLPGPLLSNPETRT